MLANSHALNICLDNANQSCPESSPEQDDEAMQLSDSDTDTEDDYMLEDDIMDLSDDIMDLSDDSKEDEDIGEDDEDEIFHSVKRYSSNILCKVVCDLFRICL